MSNETSDSLTAGIKPNKSPFPGMDPYLEGEWWSEFHDTLIHQLRVQLMPLLQPKYVVLLNKYYAITYVAPEFSGQSVKRGIYPDVHVVEIKEASVQYAFTTPAIELISSQPVEIPLLRLEIHDIAERRLVTVIEILSPVNKLGQGFQEYMDKRSAILQNPTHLLEIDLLRAGERISLVGGELPPAPYYVFLSRFTRRPITEVWPIGLKDRLPTVPVPLLPPDPDIPLALQPAIESCFELVGYQRLLDYTQSPPPPPFGPEDLAWMNGILVP